MSTAVLHMRLYDIWAMLLDDGGPKCLNFMANFCKTAVLVGCAISVAFEIQDCEYSEHLLPIEYQ